jgi:DNA-binding transcriptional regulator YiaG
MYLEDAMQAMGEMKDYVANDCGMDLDEFSRLLLASGIDELLSVGAPAVAVGRSGVELALEVIAWTGLSVVAPEPTASFDFSREYWCGWILAYYQWRSGQPYARIMESVTFADLEQMYPALHEASEDRAADAIEELTQSRSATTRLHNLRTLAGYSQSNLAKRSGVSLRAIQQYEQRQKSIDKAAAASLYALSRALSCRIEDLLEYSG